MLYKQIFYSAVIAGSVLAAELHVSVSGNDRHDGSKAKPLRTISEAARRAQPGDTVTVHAGTYRERVTPPRGGTSEARRITYRAAPRERAEIKGSEVVRGWKPYRGDVWVVALPVSFFGAYNPYTDLIEGDWFTAKGRPHHTGEVYLNGQALLESHELERVLEAQPYADARDQEGSRWKWFTETRDGSTYIYANFQGKDPNQETVEINVRDACFYPSLPGRNFITVRGFHLSHAATQWAAPTAEQIGLIGTHWSRGWVIEDNVISDSKCSCVTLGKDRATGHNVWSRNPNKDGATHYNEVILRAFHAGWSRENTGHHVVRNNTIFNCEQAGIAGSLGAVFSRITGNHIYNVWAKRQFTGAEMGGIKLHGAIDVTIEGNRIHNAGRGLWMDWMAQGTRITGNLLYDNTTDDLFVEVNHGPFLVDNNIFLSPVSLLDWSEGGAYAHNLFNGKIVNRPEPNRWTPYHRAHSTALAGVTLTHGGDNRFYNNLLRNSAEAADVYSKRKFPSVWRGNADLGEAAPRIREEGAKVVLEVTLPAPAEGVLVTTGLLGKTQVAEAGFENHDGSPLTIDQDYYKKPRPSPFAGPFAAPAAGSVSLPVW